MVLDSQGIDGLIMTLESMNQLPDLKILLASITALYPAKFACEDNISID